jgi:limonene-1,2-epoxide hydrolase
VSSAAGVVERYLHAVATHDWTALRAAVTDDVRRVGPYGDVYHGRDAYVAFLAALMPTLRGYAMEVHRVTYVDDGARAFAELTETVTLDGTTIITPEVLTFDLTGDRVISQVHIYTRRAESA